MMSLEELIRFDKAHVWHPYTSMIDPLPTYPVASAKGVRLTLEDGRVLVDGMSSWWAAIHGYNHPVLNEAARAQIESMSHVMFGGLTHRPAIELASLLIELSPEPLEKVFLCDSGSVAVEVAIKMALQYWYAVGHPDKQKLLAFRSGYHGDTFGAMSACDPITGMHHMFSHILPRQYFVKAPQCKYHEPWDEAFVEDFRNLIEMHRGELAAVILEPIVQGAGGMRFYSPHYLRRVRELCDEHDVLLILDEIATGFGRTGRFFACEHAGIAPDIMCVGKALTGGYMTLAATLTTQKVAEGISSRGTGALMHGPTFMGNPLGCAIAIASIKLLCSSPWRKRVRRIEQQLKAGLAPCADLSGVVDIRVLGAIGAVELSEPVNMASMQRRLVQRGVWIRPFGKLVYTMPPYIIEEPDLARITSAMVETIAEETQ